MKNIRTLAIETSTARGSVAISERAAGNSEHDAEKNADNENSALIFSESFTAERRHSAQLFTVLERALDFLNSLTTNRAEGCDQIVVGLGPGSYSGVRVAIAAAIGLRFGLKTRLVGRNSLTAIPTEEPHYCCIGDARQSSFYFCEIKNREVIVPPALFSETELREKLAQFATDEVQLRGQARSQVQLGNEERKIASKNGLPIFAPTPIPAFPEIQIAQPSAEILAQLAQLAVSEMQSRNFTAKTQRREDSEEEKSRVQNSPFSNSQPANDANDFTVSEILEPIYLRPPHITRSKPIR